MSEQTNPFGAGFVESTPGNFVKWEKVGDKIKGILRDVTEMDNFEKTAKEKVYTIEKEDGTEVRVNSRGQGFDQAMKKVLIGQHVGLLYAEDIKTDKGNPFKLIRVYPGPLEDEDPIKDM